MEKENKKMIGNSEGLQIEISWDDVSDNINHTVYDATSGSLSLWIGEELIWGKMEHENDSVNPVKWTWIELLEFLSDFWSYIVYEETYPLDIKPQYPSELRDLAVRRWQNMSESIATEEEKEIYHFENSHDLSRGLNGIILPTVFIMKEGNYTWIETSEFRTVRPFEETINTLEEVGNFICKRISNLEDPHAKWVYSRWNGKENVDNEELLSFIS